jgi:hypothetical protein
MSEYTKIRESEKVLGGDKFERAKREAMWDETNDFFVYNISGNRLQGGLGGIVWYGMGTTRNRKGINVSFLSQNHCQHACLFPSYALCCSCSFQMYKCLIQSSVIQTPFYTKLTYSFQISTSIHNQVVAPAPENLQGCFVW